jgi:threonine dehydrogenase-like Zn-dependent dehydrogenase
VLRVEAVGLCASDIAQLHGHKHVPGEVSPIVPGHEIVGRIHALAPDANLGVAVGDRVGVDLVRKCGTCPSCAQGTGVCARMHLYGYTIGLDVRSGLHGGYAEYMEIMGNTHLVPLTDAIPASQLSLFEPLASAINWFDRLHFQAGESIVIQGPGHMGLICAAYAKTLGAGTIVVTGTHDDGLRLEAARAVGADEVIDVDQEPVRERLADVTGGRLADVAIDLTDAAAPVGLCLELARRGGRVLWAGLKNRAPVSLISDLVPLKSLTVVGGSGSTRESMDKAGAVLNSGAYPTHALLGEVFTLDTLGEALALLARAVPGRDAVRVSLAHDVAPYSDR